MEYNKNYLKPGHENINKAKSGKLCLVHHNNILNHFNAHINIERRRNREAKTTKDG